jgi:hypothetical protein
MLCILIPRQIGLRWCNSIIFYILNGMEREALESRKDSGLANKIPSGSRKKFKPPSKPQLHKWWRSSTILGGSDTMTVAMEGTLQTLLLLTWLMDRSAKFNVVNFILLYEELCSWMILMCIGCINLCFEYFCCIKESKIWNGGHPTCILWWPIYCCAFLYANSDEP